MHRTRPALLLVGGLLCLLFFACGDDSSNESADAAAPEQTSTFPVTVQSEQGAVTIEQQPARIVSLSPSLTEMLFAMDAGDQVVAVDSNSDYPAGVPTTELSGFRPNAEAIAGYQPDLVVVSGDRNGLVTALTNLSIPVVVLPSPDHIGEVYEQLELLGDATGHPAEAGDVADTMRSELQEFADDVPTRTKPISYYYELSDTYHSVTSSTFVGEIMELAGLESIADEAPDAAGGFPQLSSEYVVDANPSVIFLSYPAGNADAKAVAGRPGWSTVDAVEAGHVVVLESDLASRWGPRLPQLLKTVIDATADVG
jgi:iron complex transport system substrate-binding protein